MFIIMSSCHDATSHVARETFVSFKGIPCEISMVMEVSSKSSTFFFSEPPPEGGLDLVIKTGCHLIDFHRVPRAGLEAWLGVHITLVSGLFVVVVTSTGVLALVPWHLLFCSLCFVC